MKIGDVAPRKKASTVPTSHMSVPQAVPTTPASIRDAAVVPPGQTIFSVMPTPSPYAPPSHFLPYSYPPYAYPPPAFSHPHMTPAPHMPNSRYARDVDMPSSDPADEAEDLGIYPLIHGWLVELDRGPHGQDGHNFAQYADDLAKEKYFRICDLEALSEASLIELCPGIAKGTATKMLAFAKKDVKRIKKETLKDTRSMTRRNGSGTRNNWYRY